MITNKRRDNRFVISSKGLRLWGLLFVAAGLFGRTIVQNGLLQLGSLSTDELLAAMDASESIMQYATLALTLQAIESLATPIFAFLLVEGYIHTSDIKKYMIRVGILAAASELLFNFATTGKIFDLDSRNPVFGLLLALVVLYLFNRFPEKKIGHIAIKVLVFAISFAWVEMLRIQDGAPIVLMVSVFWLFRKKSGLRILFGCVAAFACALFSPFYMFSPLAFIPIFMYNGQRGEENKIMNYAVYPVMLIVFAIATTLV